MDALTKTRKDTLPTQLVCIEQAYCYIRRIKVVPAAFYYHRPFTLIDLFKTRSVSQVPPAANCVLTEATKKSLIDRLV